MTKQNIKLGLLVFVCYLFQNMIIAQALPTIKDHPEVTLERTEIRALHSNIVGQNYELLISLPYSYATADTSYPVIFLLDPYRVFSMVKEFTDALTVPFAINPEVIVVGIGYGGEGINARLNWALGRVRDYTPVQDTATEEWYEEAIKKAGIHDIDVISGGAPLFLEFIRKELFPFIESNYRIDTNIRMLSGYSFGGLFGLYALFHDTELFDKYFIGSPSIGFKDGISLEYESNYANTHEDLKASVFMSVGGKEESYAKNLQKMLEQLNSRNYKNLKLKSVIFENESHVTCYPAALSRGLIELFNNEDGN
ncbi:MAG: alpha/beta hydrolase [Bacteroidetes bacterium]|nr:alpha/beta hydrolase [Bacteroidota bacterium]